MRGVRLMSVTLGEICAALHDGGYDLGVFASTNKPINGLQLLTDPGARPAADALNLCTVSVFMEMPEKGGCSFICCEDAAFSADFAASVGADVILIRDCGDLAGVANVVIRELADSAFAYEVSAQMFSALADASALQHIIRIAGEALGCQMVLADTARNVLVHNVPDVPKEEDQWEVFIGRGVAPSFSRNSGCRIYDKVELSQSYVLNLVDNSRLGVTNAICDIMSDGRQIGFLSLLVDKAPLSSKQYRVIAALCDAVRLELESHGQPGTARALSYEGFLKNLLESRNSNPEHIRILASKISMPVEGFFAVFAFELAEDYGNSAPASLREMLDGIEAALEESRAVNHNGRLIVLVDYHDREGFSKRDYTQLEELISRWKLNCGMSRPFYRLYDIHKHFLEALDSAGIAKYTKFLSDPNFGSINYYERCEPFVLMHDATEHGVDLRKFVHPFAVKLNDYDEEHDTEYIRTLFEYIRTPKKPQAAEALFIHRNTLDYRLKKIQELVEFSWDDGETLSRMYFSIIILMYLRARDKYNSGENP